MAKKLIKYLRPERPDYNYLRDLFRHLRKELDVPVTTNSKRLPVIPTEEEIKKYYEAVWQAKNIEHMVMIKTLLYTGIRVSELIRVKISDVDFERCQIRINQGKGGKDRVVPFPMSFREILSMYVTQIQGKKAVHLFESSWKKAYSDRGIRKILMRYTQAAGIESSDESRQSLEIYSRLSIKEAQQEYNENIGKFPV